MKLKSVNKMLYFKLDDFLLSNRHKCNQKLNSNLQYCKWKFQNFIDAFDSS